MDDVIVLSPTRHKLRRAVKVVNETFAELGLEKHPDKTFIGRIERGFDFLGYHLAPGRLPLARATVERFLERAHRLYEQDRREPQGSLRSDAYIRRWCGWAGEFGVASPALSAPTVEIHTRALPAGSRRLP